MKGTLLFFLFFWSAINCLAQSEVEKFLVRQGFENVRHITDNGKEFFYLESKAFPTNGRIIGSICKSLDSISPRLKNDQIDIVLLKNRLPVFHMQSNRTLKNKSERLIWRSDFRVNESYKVLRNNGSGKRFINSSFAKIDLLFYPQFRFKNVTLDKMYLFQININPTFEISLWKGAILTAQVVIPLLNEYSEEESEIRPGFLTFSQDFKIPGNLYARATIGNFSQFRGGADLKVFKPIGDRVGLYGQIGITAMSIMLFDTWYYSDLNRTTWRAGVNYFAKPWNLMFNFSVGKYLAGDFSARGEIMRHFKNSTVGFYLQTIEIDEYPVNGGFFFSIALPPYFQKRTKGFRISPARYFNFEYLARPYPNEGRMYQTAPDESTTENFFNTMRLNQIIKTTN